jgi:hypothetical protein
MKKKHKKEREKKKKKRHKIEFLFILKVPKKRRGKKSIKFFKNKLA